MNVKTRQTVGCISHCHRSKSVQGNSGYEGREDKELFYSTPAFATTAWFAAVRSISSEHAQYPTLRSLAHTFLVSLLSFCSLLPFCSLHPFFVRSAP